MIHAARRLLEALEMGRLDTADTFHLVEQADPALVYLLVSWLRRRYARHSARDGVFGRIVALCQRYPRTTGILEQGGKDPIAEWFEESWDYRDLDADEMIAIVVEKLES